MVRDDNSATNLIHELHRNRHVSAGSEQCYRSSSNKKSRTRSDAALLSMCWQSLLFNRMVIKAHADQMRHVIGTHFIIDTGSMCFDCFGADIELFSDFSAGQPA